MSYASNDEIEKLQRLRTELKNKMVMIETEQKTLGEEMKAIRQKVAIRELLKSVRRRRDELAGLRIQKARSKDK